jgi:predicted transcriptional regulator
MHNDSVKNYNNFTGYIVDMKRQPTSLKVDPDLWQEVKIMAIKRKKTVSEYFEEALREKLTKDKLADEEHAPHLA